MSTLAVIRHLLNLKKKTNQVSYVLLLSRTYPNMELRITPLPKNATIEQDTPVARIAVHTKSNGAEHSSSRFQVYTTYHSLGWPGARHPRHVT